MAHETMAPELCSSLLTLAAIALTTKYSFVELQHSFATHAPTIAF